MDCCDIKAVKIRRNYENRGYHGWFDKRFMYEESLRMPLVVRYPERIESGSVSENIVSNLDFAPTFLELAGAEIPTEMQGHSLKTEIKRLQALCGDSDELTQQLLQQDLERRKKRN